MYVSNDANYKSSFLKELKVDDFTLIDGRSFLKQVPQNEQLQHQTLIEVGKTQLVINNKDGEIIDNNKSVFISWNKILEKVSNYLKLILENFEKTALIKRIRLNSAGLTEKGIVKRNNLDNEFTRLEEKILNS